MNSSFLFKSTSIHSQVHAKTQEYQGKQSSIKEQLFVCITIESLLYKENRCVCVYKKIKKELEMIFPGSRGKWFLSATHMGFYFFDPSTFPVPLNSHSQKAPCFLVLFHLSLEFVSKHFYYFTSIKYLGKENDLSPRTNF